MCAVSQLSLIAFSGTYPNPGAYSWLAVATANNASVGNRLVSPFPRPYSLDEYIYRYSGRLHDRRFAILYSWLTLIVVISRVDGETAYAG